MANESLKWGHIYSSRRINLAQYGTYSLNEPNDVQYTGTIITDIKKAQEKGLITLRTVIGHYIQLSYI